MHPLYPEVLPAACIPVLVDHRLSDQRLFQSGHPNCCGRNFQRCRRIPCARLATACDDCVFCAGAILWHLVQHSDPGHQLWPKVRACSTAPVNAGACCSIWSTESHVVMPKAAGQMLACMWSGGTCRDDLPCWPRQVLCMQSLSVTKACAETEHDSCACGQRGAPSSIGCAAQDAAGQAEAMCWLFFEGSDLAPAQGQAYRSMHDAPVKDAYGVQRCVNETLHLYGVRAQAPHTLDSQSFYQQPCSRPSE